MQHPRYAVRCIHPSGVAEIWETSIAGFLRSLRGQPIARLYRGYRSRSPPGYWL